MASERPVDIKPVAANGGEGNTPYRSPSDESRYYYTGTPETLLTRPTPRRSKRHVPDGEKDNKYWEKRKRNNDAARRSRETKRRMDMDVRQRVLLLEEELSLARKELTVIKIKFGLPLDQRFLNADDSGDLVSTPASTPLPESLTPPMASPMTSSMPPGITSDAIDNRNAYSLSTSSTGTNSQSLDASTRPADTNSRHQGPTSVNTDLDHLTSQSQISPTETMPVKKRRRGRKEWEESEDQAEISEVGDAYYGRMMAGNAYPGLLWPSSAPAGSPQFPFPNQMPMVGPSAYQALLNEQQRLPSINAFSNVTVKPEHPQHQQQQHQEPSQHQHQQHHPHQQHQAGQEQQPQQQQQQHTQQHSQQHTQQHAQQPQSNGTHSDPPTPDSFEYLAGQSGNSLPRYYVPYSEADTPSRPSSSLTPADLSITKGRHLTLTGNDVADQPGRNTHHQQIGVVQPMQGNQQHLQQHQQHQHQQQQQQQQQHHHQQHQQQQQQQAMSSASDEEEHQERIMVANSDIRNRLQQLTAEVAKMKDYVLKDNVRTITSAESQ